MVPPKKKSKRSTVRLRHKIEKRSNEKQRKERKAAKKDVTWKSKTPKPIGIPNSFPYKDKILAEIEQQKIKRAEEIERKKEEAKAKRKALAEQGMEGEDVMEDVDETAMSDDDDDLMSEDEVVSSFHVWLCEGSF
jgi:nuclear GTP-binding protein